jgi:hypothetical protein
MCGCLDEVKHSSWRGGLWREWAKDNWATLTRYNLSSSNVEHEVAHVHDLGVVPLLSMRSGPTKLGPLYLIRLTGPFYHTILLNRTRIVGRADRSCFYGPKH